MEQQTKNAGNSCQDGDAEEKLPIKRPYTRRKVTTTSISVPKSEWSRRRFRLDFGLIAILLAIGYILFTGSDSVLYQQAVLALIAAGVTLMGQYIFGAAWDDSNYMKMMGRMRGPAPSSDSDAEYDSTETTTQIPDKEE